MPTFALHSIAFAFALVATASSFAPSKAADGSLTEAEVRKMIAGNDVQHDEMTFYFKGDGSFDAADGRTASNGKYSIEKSGNICWQNSRGFAGCFQYYRRGAELRVRRNDARSKSDISAVTVTTHRQPR